MTEMMGKEEWNEIEKLASLIGVIGNVDSYKKLKSIVYMCSVTYPKLFNYQWDKRFFGPQSSELVNVLEGAINKAFLDEYFIKPEKETYPIHHGYKPTSMAFSYTKNQIDAIKQDYKNAGITDFESFLYDLVALRSLPTAVVLNESLRISDEREQLRNYPDNKEYQNPSTYTRLDYSIHFNKENLDKLKNYYENNGMSATPIIKSQNYELTKIEFDPKKVEEFINKRYEYLRLHNIMNKKINVKPIHDNIEKIGLNIEETKLEEKTNVYLNKVQDKNYIKKSDERLNFVLEGIKDVLKLSGDVEKGLQTKFYFSSAFELIVHDDLKNHVNNWQDSYLLDLYHLFQPFERVAYMSNQM